MLASLSQMQSEGIDGKIYTHPLGYHGLGQDQLLAYGINSEPYLAGATIPFTPTLRFPSNYPRRQM